MYYLTGIASRIAEYLRERKERKRRETEKAKSDLSVLVNQELSKGMKDDMLSPRVIEGLLYIESLVGRA